MNGVQAREKGNALYKRGQLTEAIKAYQEAARRAEPDDYLPWSNLSAAYYEVGNFHESIQCAQQALAICQGHSDDNGTKSRQTTELKLIPRILRAYLHTHQFDAARQWLHRLADIQSPSSADELRQYQGALDHAEIVWRAFPDEETYTLQLLAELPRYQSSSMQRNGDLPSSKDISLDQVTDLVDFTVHSNIDRNLAVFLGGISDARHFYAQLAILGVTERMVMHSTTPLKRKYQFTLNDSNSAVIARNLVLLVLLDELACQTDIPQAERTEIYTTVYYIFSGVIIPRYALGRLLHTVDSVVGRLKTSQRVLPWLQIYDLDRAHLIGALESWLDFESDDRNSTSNAIDRTVRSLHDYSMPYNSRAPPGCQKELETYFELPLLQAPRSVTREHEPELLQLIETNASIENLRSYVNGKWFVNPTMSEMDVSNPFDICRALYNIVSIQERGGPKKTKLFDYASSFFQMIVVALRKIRGRLSVEYVVGDLAVAIDGIRYGLVEGRHSTTPTVYDLVHLSRPCDIPTVISASKILNESQAARLMISTSGTDSGLGERCNSGCFTANDSTTLYKVTQMQTVSKKSQDASSTSSDECLLELRRDKLAPFSYEHLLSRGELSRFLFSQFFSVSLPLGNAMSTSANLTYFFDLLIHLHSIGYPAHWLADVLAKILGDGVNSSPSPPRTPDETNPRNPLSPSTTMRGVYGSVASFIPEASTLASIFQRLLPFNVITSLPPLSTIHQYILHFKTGDGGLSRTPMALMIYNNHDIPATTLPFPEEEYIIILTFTYTPTDDGHARVKFWMREDIITQLQSSSPNETWHCTLLHISKSSSNHNSTNEDEAWKPFTEQSVSINSAIKGEQWLSPTQYACSDTDGVMELDS
ncbi:hypothetical protein TSTA_021060 [Talaromyces stipitatus ATCC 10500]|uniref:DUF4470 domain-containing protein n=1 Tax=Talaromyces stipitatus (strain ATCC 10500 / CBS 375.48 / QM 6759 / NRRL 1006) TaxID=441959 RepID=B8MFQ5_TALSN|nr:uncharacterized protein TSTA_021060 [Talaromyces stipitatus ATCC 10500]EED17045.1 hypothetical protein TSTA_021060 [Talaromyces stipitatus ATCC 10500]